MGRIRYIPAIFLVATVSCLAEFPTASVDLVALFLLSGNSEDGGSSSSGPLEASAAQSLYAGFSDWNDYVKNDGVSRISASGTACTGTETGGYAACIHAGLMKSFTISGRTDCTGLTGTDSEKAFFWGCDDSTGVVRMIALGLVPAKGLNDLIDFSAGDWKDLTMTVQDDAATFSTTPAKWWSNPIVKDPAGSPVTLGVPGTVYLFTADQQALIDITADRVAMVSSQIFFWRGDVAAGGNVISASNRNFLWVEPGLIHAGNDDTGVYWDNVKFSVLQFARVQSSADNAIEIANSSNNYFNYLQSASWSVAGSGIRFTASSNNTIANLTAASGFNFGVLLETGSNDNVLMNVTAFNTDSDAFHINASTNNAVLNATVANANNNSGMELSSGANNTTIMNLAAVNSTRGLNLVNIAPRTTLINISSSRNIAEGAYVDSANNFFSGLVKVGNNPTNCFMGGGALPGLTAGCAVNGSSNFGVNDPVDLSASFVDKVGVDDSLNTEVSSLELAAGIADWLLFQNFFRGWGQEGSAGFPQADQRSYCTAPATCRIYDWSLSSGDGLIREVLPVPDGNQVALHYWSAATQPACENIPGALWLASSACSLPGYFDQVSCQIPGGDWISAKCFSVYLRNAYEIIGDSAGNENGLCELYENCIYTPNIGAYQGHQGITYVSTITSGILNNIDLFRLTVNGL